MDSLFGLNGLLMIGFAGLIWLGWYLCKTGVDNFHKVGEDCLPDELRPSKPITVVLMALGFFLIIAGITPMGAFLARMIS